MEGIDDIVRQIRFAANMPNCVDRFEALALAKRIEAAYERGYRALQVQIGRLENDYIKRTAENAKLRAALEKVVACRDGVCVKTGCSCPAAAAVRRACSVYRKIYGNRKEGKTE